MDTKDQSEKDFQESEIELLEDLVGCLDREREILADLDTRKLWAVTEEKHGILQAIEALPPVMAEEASAVKNTEADPGSGPNTVPNQTIDRLKEEIRERARENAAFIRDSLDFVDDLVGLLAGVPRDGGTYQPHGGSNREHRPRLYRREV